MSKHPFDFTYICHTLPYLSNDIISHWGNQKNVQSHSHKDSQRVAPLYSFLLNSNWYFPFISITVKPRKTNKKRASELDLTPELRGKTACPTAGWTAQSAGTGPTGRPVCGRTCRELGQQWSQASSSINGTSWKWAWKKRVLFRVCIQIDFLCYHCQHIESKSRDTSADGLESGLLCYTRKCSVQGKHSPGGFDATSSRNPPWSQTTLPSNRKHSAR